MDVARAVRMCGLDDVTEITDRAARFADCGVCQCGALTGVDRGDHGIGRDHFLAHENVVSAQILDEGRVLCLLGEPCGRNCNRYTRLQFDCDELLARGRGNAKRGIVIRDGENTFEVRKRIGRDEFRPPGRHSAALGLIFVVRCMFLRCLRRWGHGPFVAEADWSLRLEFRLLLKPQRIGAPNGCRAHVSIRVADTSNNVFGGSRRHRDSLRFT
ncbi:hypothetical protein AWB82_06961 [Caballeronia glebae]|uniref:Uncharacterized protein n=1 Tax=Caballeronia glebae TaxID=1777143 RepID=A0A158DPZ1_9BURK|nr:hypothetical protein AWB82_06961 [Caballeronia glebae]